ncbi:helix-turn-helix transcriptional regulator (plasmid) [Marinobacter sp. M3C]|uniref:response regulator transcription factor n=1 Tax=Marinobacter sp. M3C TaxID=2917715 RepID=UPI00201069A3|nr:helix-turn-helix transcriptional regulator [Marinobacter sp. M3C]MCL1485160.1 helix-turn-helix transcriptional regulator [Marinobacter sp.]UQG62815.1 helix-turn-helix transcriptional regulator [Marinobacter sp. M3C]
MGRKLKPTYPRMLVELADTTLLPPRRGQVVMLAARGMSAKEIARDLGISPDTVSWHLDEAKDQFHASSRVDLISQGWMAGLFRARMLTWALMVFAMAPALRSRPSSISSSRPPVTASRIGRTQISSQFA